LKQLPLIQNSGRPENLTAGGKAEPFRKLIVLQQTPSRIRYFFTSNSYSGGPRATVCDASKDCRPGAFNHERWM
jgi:hypothetical protein